MKISIVFLHIRINLGSKLQLQQRILSYGTNFQKRIFPVKNKKNKHHHEILHIQISLCINFQLNLTILIFWTKFAQKGCFQSKTGKMNTTT